MPGPSCTPPGPGGHVMALGTAASPMRSAKPPESWFWGAVGLGLFWMPVATKHRLRGKGGDRQWKLVTRGFQSSASQ